MVDVVRAWRLLELCTADQQAVAVAICGVEERSLDGSHDLCPITVTKPQKRIQRVVVVVTDKRRQRDRTSARQERQEGRKTVCVCVYVCVCVCVCIFVCVCCCLCCLPVTLSSLKTCRFDRSNSRFFVDMAARFTLPFVTTCMFFRVFILTLYSHASLNSKLTDECRRFLYVDTRTRTLATEKDQKYLTTSAHSIQKRPSSGSLEYDSSCNTNSERGRVRARVRENRPASTHKRQKRQSDTNNVTDLDTGADKQTQAQTSRHTHACMRWLMHRNTLTKSNRNIRCMNRVDNGTQRHNELWSAISLAVTSPLPLANCLFFFALNLHDCPSILCPSPSHSLAFAASGYSCHMGPPSNQPPPVNSFRP